VRIPNNLDLHLTHSYFLPHPNQVKTRYAEQTLTGFYTDHRTWSLDNILLG